MSVFRRWSRRERTPGDLRRTTRLFRRFMGNRKVYVVGVLLLLVEAVTAVVEPYPIAVLVDFLQGARPSLRDLGLPPILESERMETILVLTVAIILIAAVNSAADSFTEVCMARGGRSLGYSIRVAMYSHLQRLPLAYHDRKRTGDVLTRVTGDVLVLEDFVVKSVSNIIGSLMVLVGSFAFLLYQSWSVAIVAVVVIPVLGLISNYFSKRIKVASKTQRDREGDLASTTQEMLSSIRLVQSYGRGKVDLDTFSNQTSRSMVASLRAANIQAKFSFVIAIVEALSIAAVVWLGVWLVDRKAITIGTLVLFVLLLQNMFKPARKIVSEWYKIGKVFASVERIEDLLDREVGVREAPDAVAAPPLSGRLTFRHVSFSYPAESEAGIPEEQRPAALRDIDFEVAPGEVVALVGFSGAGKSTIAQLVPRLYDPDEGTVLVDDLDVRGLTLASLRHQVSVVLQDTVLLSGTVADNIAYGVDEASREEVEAAARMANAHGFIMDLPQGYDTPLGERGSTLSGGQRQRLAIARAFIRRAPILILDEPTTGLDTESAQTVVSALRGLMEGTTTVVISHDPGLVRCADRVMVVAGGEIVEAGTHDDLLDQDGVYADLYRAYLAPHPGTVATPEAVPVPRPHTSRVASPLAARLAVHLPGLPAAMDGQGLREELARVLAPGGGDIEDLDVGKVWLRDDGSCGLRYRVRLAGAAEDGVVLGRLFHDEVQAQHYLDHRVRPMESPGHARAPARSRLATRGDLAPGAGLALHAFPLDPDLATLPQAVAPGRVAALLRASTDSALAVPGLPTVEVVHHPREGACVLRYTFGERPDDGQGVGATVLYGKVYPDTSGDVIEAFLDALATSPHAAARGAEGVAPMFPRPVLYSPSLRLLVTHALPGSPRIPELLRAVLGGPAETRDRARAALLEAVGAAGAALASLHGSDLATAPVRSVVAERDALASEIGLVERYWPEVAQQVRRLTDNVVGASPGTPDMVLSHGDFTPSQVLLDGAGTAVVDLDTLCWADPALDLGRFIAHVELQATKLGGERAAPLVEELTAVFLDGHARAGGLDRPVTGEALHRITHYRATTLARSSLHACRQLKDGRMEGALSLLDSLNTRRL